MALTWPTPSLPILKSEDSPIGVITAEEESWLTALAFVGAVIASPIFSYISQQYGRKIAGYILAIPFIIGWLLKIISESIILFTLEDFEISEDSIRGTLGAFRSTIVCLAGLFVCAVGTIISIQAMAIICIDCAFFVYTFAFSGTRVPDVFNENGKNERSYGSFDWLRGGNKEVAEEEMSKLNV
ncbi:hypothetical protein L9F63_028408, partial [Diploptera punctata]